jgi:hypothetical protein
MKFNQALYILLTALGLILSYEALHPYVPALQIFEPSHFWTAYTEDSSTNHQLDIDTSMALNEIDSSLLVDDSNLNKDSLQQEGEFVVVGEDTLYISNFEEYDGLEHLAEFFKKLQEVRQGKRKRIRIAYFGDSTTEGDLIVGELRDSLQKIFGGRGVGYVSIAPHGTVLRRTLRHKYTENWDMVNYFRKNKSTKFQFGISGDYSTARGKAMNKSHRLTFRPAWGKYPTMNYFNEVYLFYGQPQDSSLQVPTLFANLNQGDTTTYELIPDQEVNRISLTENGAGRIDLAFNFPQPFPIFGLSFESETGVLVDNFAKRNDSGSHLSRINSKIMQQFYDYLGCDLVILHYGANVLHKTRDYSYYEPVLTAGVRNFQRNMKGVPVLIIGSTDRVDKIEGKEQTTPAVYGLIQSQKKVAVQTQNPFFDVFKAMGGEGTMLDWAAKDPPLVAPDYVHFNHRGGQIIAYKLLDFLLDGYQELTKENVQAGDPETFMGKAFLEVK